MLLLSNLICLFLLQGVSLASKRSRTQSIETPKPPKILLTTDEIIQIMFPNKVVKLYTDSYESVFLPDDLWLHIASKLDSLLDLFRLGLLNKRIGSLIRANNLFQDHLKNHPWKDYALLDFLYESDFNVHLYHKGMFTPEKMKSFSVHLNFKNNVISDAHQTKYEPEPIIRFIERMAEKGYDVKIIIYLFKNFIKKGKYLKVPSGVAYDLYGGTRNASASDGNLNLELHYLPPAGSPDLFKTVSVSEVANIMIRSSPEQLLMFHACLLAHYVIPMWRGAKVDLSDYELKSLKELLHYMSYSFREYFTDLSWALYFATGTCRKDEKHHTGPISRFLVSLGLSWEDLVPKKHSTKYYADNDDSQIDYISSIYTAANHWGLDIKKIAQKVPNCKESVEILAGNIPEDLGKRFVLCPENTLMHSLNDQRKLIMVGNEVYSTGSDELRIALKRKMEEHGFDENPAKRQRGEFFATPERTGCSMSIDKLVMFEVPNSAISQQIADLHATLNMQITAPLPHETAVDIQSGRLLFLRALKTISDDINNTILQNACQWGFNGFSPVPNFLYQPVYQDASYQQAPILSSYFQPTIQAGFQEDVQMSHDQILNELNYLQ